jgi:EAL domain-containing protein (putative c-di-GMP-specific phosphodiesterase class I)
VPNASSRTDSDSGTTVTAVLDALRAPVLMVDAELEVTAANPTACELLGRGADDLVGHRLPALLERADADAALRAAAAVGRGEPWEMAAQVGIGSRSLAVRLQGAPLPPGTGAVAVVALAPVSAPTGSPTEELAEELADALRGDAIVLHFQPIVRLHDRRPVAAEALVRWEHPQRGLLRPVDFLDAADSAALAGPLGRRVLRQACHAASTWAHDVRSRPGVQVAVNLSERQLFEAGTVTFVRDALAVADCPPERLLIEVAEESLLRDPETAGRALSALKELGVDLAVDDLGTGSSALSYLKRFPIDVVKVDRSLVAGLGHDPDQSAVVASLISMAQAIGVRCVAEGVETADQLTVLRRLGCELGQGYLFSRALGTHAAGEWLARALSPRSTPAPRAGAAPRPEVVAQVLELQTEGASLHTIAARLNAEGHRNEGGRRWHHTSVAQLIAGHLYPDLHR